MDSDQIAERRAFFERRLEEQERDFPGWAAAWTSFCPALLAHGGTLVVPPPTPDLLLEMQRDQGQVFDPSTLEVRVGDDDCHRNAARLWRTGAASAVGTGYALSDDQLWREHSWAWTAAGVLIETTVPRTRYFGIRFDGEDARWFADWVDPTDGDEAG